MKKLAALSIIVIVSGVLLYTSSLYAVTLNAGPIGFASMNGGTTGGNSGTEHTVSSGDEINNLCKKGASNLKIYVNGTITTSNTTSEEKIVVKEVSNISLIGVGTRGVLNGIGIKIVKSQNIIIQNLVIHNVRKNTGDGDCICIEGPVNNVWIDHCELYNDLDNGKEYYDGLLDVKKSSEYITVSHCYLHDSYKTSLVGSSSGDTYDRKMTYHHNYLLNCNSRLPSYRGGTGHYFNNVVVSSKEGIGASGVNVRVGAKMRIEGNYFQKIGNGEVDDDCPLELEQGPIGAWYCSEPGFWDVKDNTFVICLGNQPTTSTCSYAPPYNYTAESSNTVVNSVLQNVGAEGSNPEPIPTVGISSEENQHYNLQAFSVSYGIVRFTIEKAGNTIIQLFDIKGKRVAGVTKHFTVGNQAVLLSNNISDGLYVITLHSNNVQRSMPLALTSAY